MRGRTGGLSTSDRWSTSGFVGYIHGNAECKFPRVMYDWADSLDIRTVHYIVFWALFIAAHYQVACRPGPAAYDERSLRP